MEEYLENMKSLRSYMNDLEEDAAKRSAEEQQQRTAIDAHDAEIALVRAQVQRAREEAEQLAEVRAQVCVDMTEKQGRIAALEVEGATLKQECAVQEGYVNILTFLASLGVDLTLELVHQEIASTSAKLNDKRLFYTDTMENMTVKLQEQQEWLGSLKNRINATESLVATSNRKCNAVEGEMHGKFMSEESVDQLGSDVGNKQRELNIQVESTQLKIEGIKSERTTLILEINKSKQILEQEKNIIVGFPAALQQMDMKSLEEEYKALHCDKAEEIQYFQSLDETIKGMKSISGVVKCPCGLEYKVELGGEAMDIS